MRISTPILSAALLLSASAYALDVKVESIRKVPVAEGTEIFHPVFTPDGKSLIVTSEAFDGLGIIDLESTSYRRLSDLHGAGYKAAISPVGDRIVIRENHDDEQTISLFALSVDDAKITPVASHIGHINTVTINDGVIAMPSENAVMTWVDPMMPRTLSVEEATPATIVTEEDLKLVVYRNGVRTVVDPILETTGRDVNYCWSSLSPDGTRLLFVAHNNAYTSNLDGSNLVDLGVLHAPVWRDDNTVVGMIDSDDGHFFTASDIFIADARTAETVQLTPVSDEIKMFPSVSPDGNRIAFHTTDGGLYIITLSTSAK